MAATGIRPHTTSVTIVVLGSFLPDAFLPKALADAEVISQQDARKATARALLSGLIAQFDFGWCELSVAPERFQIGTVEAPYVRVCDFAVKALREIPRPGGLTAFGINVESHFDVGSPGERDALGRRLAPPKAWGKWGSQVDKSMERMDQLHGGMMVLQMRQPFEAGDMSGFLDVIVGPSNKVGENSGVYFRTNHHHAVSGAGRQTNAGKTVAEDNDSLKLLDALLERFDASVETAENLFVDVLEGKSA